MTGLFSLSAILRGTTRLILLHFIRVEYRLRHPPFRLLQYYLVQDLGLFQYTLLEYSARYDVSPVTFCSIAWNCHWGQFTALNFTGAHCRSMRLRLPFSFAVLLGAVNGFISLHFVSCMECIWRPFPWLSSDDSAQQNWATSQHS